ncbi:hypothetical protein [Devosia sp. 2618]|uniref:hypothetical protein n=1 Tax=Devosia sp. 2618 TaxID=3156454 RepID=UPI003397DE87
MMTIFHPTVPGLHDAIMELVEAIRAETHAFRTTPDDEAGEAVTGAAVDRKLAAEQALLTYDKSAILADMDQTGDMALVHALALSRRHYLVMEAGYQSEGSSDECLLVDLLLHGAEPFDSVPLLWHISGKSRDERPSDAELQAGWNK